CMVVDARAGEDGGAARLADSGLREVGVGRIAELAHKTDADLRDAGESPPIVVAIAHGRYGIAVEARGKALSPSLRLRIGEGQAVEQTPCNAFAGGDPVGVDVGRGARRVGDAGEAAVAPVGAGHAGGAVAGF